VKLNVGLSRQNQHSTIRKLFSGKMGLNLRKKLMKCYTGYIALCDAENWTLRRINQEYLGSFEMWCCRRMEKIHWSDRVKSVFNAVKKERTSSILKPKAG
jgi:hypothetical protein